MQRDSSNDNDAKKSEKQLKQIYDKSFSETSNLRSDLLSFAQIADSKLGKVYLDKLKQLFTQLDIAVANIDENTVMSTRMENVSTIKISVIQIRNVMQEVIKELKGKYDIEKVRPIQSIYHPMQSIINHGNDLISALAINRQQEKLQESKAPARGRSDVVTSSSLASVRPDAAPPHAQKKQESFLKRSGLFGNNKPPKPEEEKRAKSSPAKLENDTKSGGPKHGKN